MAVDVVPGALQRRPHVCLQVGDVAEVQRLQDLADDQSLEEHHLGYEHVELDVAAGDLRDRFVDRGEGADLNLYVVLLLERVDHVVVDVLVPVVETQRSLLGLQRRGDRLVAGVDRKRHRVVGARQWQSAGSVRRRPATASSDWSGGSAGRQQARNRQARGDTPCAFEERPAAGPADVREIMSAIRSHPCSPLVSGLPSPLSRRSMHPSSEDASARHRSIIRSAVTSG